jgi:hypothetical protein
MTHSRRESPQLECDGAGAQFFPFLSFFLSRGINRNMEWGGRRRRRRKPFLGVLGNCKSNMKDDDVPGVGA